MVASVFTFFFLPHFSHLFAPSIFNNHFPLFLSHLAEGCRSPTGKKLLIKVKASPAEQTETWECGLGGGPLSHCPSTSLMIVHVKRLACKFYLIGQISLITKSELTVKVKVLFCCTNLFVHKACVCVCFKIYFLAYIACPQMYPCICIVLQSRP